MNANQYNKTAEILASIKYVKEVKEVKQVKQDKEDNDVKCVKEVKEDKEVKQFSTDLDRLKALAARRETEDLSPFSLESLREENNSSGFDQELLDSSQKVEWLCDGPGQDHWARFRCEHYTQETGRGIEYKVKVLLTAEDGSYIELMSNVGRKYDFTRGLESTIEDNPWYERLWKSIDQENTKCGKFYIANTKNNKKENRNTTPEPYTAVTITKMEPGAYGVKLWLWNAEWNLVLTDSFLTERQKQKNMLAKTQWFNPNSTNNNRSRSALDMLGWKKEK